MVTSGYINFIITVQPRLTAIQFIRPPCYYGHIPLNQMEKSLSHFIILKTPIMRPARYYDQDFMAQRGGRINGVPLYETLAFLFERVRHLYNSVRRDSRTLI